MWVELKTFSGFTGPHMPPGGGYWATPQGLAAAVVAVVGVTLLCYGNSVRGELVWDDVPAIVENRDVRGGPGNPVAALLWRDFWGFELQSSISHKVVTHARSAPYISILHAASRKAQATAVPLKRFGSVVVECALSLINASDTLRHSVG